MFLFLNSKSSLLISQIILTYSILLSFHVVCIFSYLSWGNKYSFFKFLSPPVWSLYTLPSFFLLFWLLSFMLVLSWDFFFKSNKVVKCWFDYICIHGWCLSNSGLRCSQGNLRGWYPPNCQCDREILNAHSCDPFLWSGSVSYREIFPLLSEWGKEMPCALGGENGKGAWEFLCPVWAFPLILLLSCSAHLSRCFVSWWRC